MALLEMYMRTGGNDLNAGSTNQDAANFTYASGNLATVTNVATFTVASGNPQADGVQVGDKCSIYVDGDSATPFVGIVTGVTTTTITCATNTNKLGTIPSNGTGNRSLKIGGAWAGLGLCASGRILASGTNSLGSLRINVQAGTYSNAGTARAVGLAGTASLPIYFRGYKTATGDQDSNPTAARVAGTDIPLFSWGDAGFTCSSGFVFFENLAFVSARTGGATVTSGPASNPVFFRRCQVENTNAGASSVGFAISGAGQVTLDASHIKATTTASSALSCSGVPLITQCRVLGGVLGIQVTGTLNQTNIFRTIVAGCTSHGIQLASTWFTIFGCSIYATGGDGIRVTNISGATASIMGCRFGGSGGYDINSSAGTTSAIYLRGNVTHGWTLGHLNGVGDAYEFAALTDSASPFTNAAGGDFSPASGSNGNAVRFDFENDSNVAYYDVGALQRAAGGSADYPTVGNVRSGVTYASGAMVGTLAVPAAADVQAGVTFGADGTEYTGTFAAPAAGDVQSGVTYGGGGNEFTGTFAAPAAGNVRNGVGYGAAGTEFTGTLALPAAGDVQAGMTFGAGGDEYTGTFATPGASNVRNGIGYGAGGSEFTGTCFVPTAANVRSGVAVDAGAGTLTLPAVTDVKLGTQYGGGGNEFAGTFIVSINLNLAGQFSG